MKLSRRSMGVRLLSLTISAVAIRLSGGKSFAQVPPGDAGWIDTPAPDQLSATPVALPTVAPAVVWASGPGPVVTTVPLRLKIPRIGVNARVEPVDLEADGSMGTPSGPWTVGWWDRGFLPGQPGSAVIDGHVDYRNVGPAVFWRLDNLRPGDLIQITMPGDAVLTFVVDQTAVYTADESAPVARIFAPSDVPRLNLITCTGTFDPSSRSYDRRLVVFSKLATS